MIGAGPGLYSKSSTENQVNFRVQPSLSLQSVARTIPGEDFIYFLFFVMKKKFQAIVFALIEEKTFLS